MIFLHPLQILSLTLFNPEGSDDNIVYLDDCDDESGVVEREVAALEAAINGVVGQGKGGDYSQAPSQAGGIANRKE